MKIVNILYDLFKETMFTTQLCKTTHNLASIKLNEKNSKTKKLHVYSTNKFKQ